MGILDRLSRSIKSNLNGMIDKAEDPAKIIQQTIDDMQDELKKARQEVVQALATAKQLEKKIADQVKESEEWQRKAVLAIEHGDDQLAREAIRRQKKAETDAVETDKLRQQQQDYVGELRASIDGLEKKVEELKARRGILAAQVSRARSGSVDPLEGGGVSSPALQRLKAMQGRIEDMEAEVEAQGILEDPKRTEVEEKFRRLERAEKRDVIDDELAALKRRLKK